MKGLRIFALAALFLFALGAAITASADDNVTVTGITRISHPVYRMGNLWYGVRNPWNRDFTRILIYEKRDYTDPATGKTGRGLVWGFISDLKSWKTLADYEAAAKPLPDNSYWQANSTFWSPIPGEENIIYGVYTADQSIRRLNVDTGEITYVAPIDPGDGTDVSSARGLGFATDYHFMVNFHLTDLYSGGYEIDVQTGQRTRYSKILEKCDPGSQRWPAPVWRSGHFTASGDGKWWVEDGGGNVVTLTDRNTCQTTTFSTQSISPRTLSHFSWFNQGDWFIVDDRGVGGDYNSTPTVEPFRIYKMNTDGSFSVLLETMTAQYSYIDHNGHINDAYNARPLSTIRKDGKQILFTSTDGKYLYEDYKRTGVTPWGTEGAFLADLSVSPGATSSSNPGNGAGSPAPELVSPATGQMVSDPVTFVWKKTADSNMKYSLVYSQDKNFDNNVAIEVASAGGKGVLYAGMAPVFAWPILLFGGIALAVRNDRRGRKALRLISLIMILGFLVISCGGGGGGTAVSSDSPGQGNTTATPADSGDMNYTVSGLNSKTTYYWKVVATDASTNQKSESEVRSFETE